MLKIIRKIPALILLKMDYKRLLQINAAKVKLIKETIKFLKHLVLTSNSIVFRGFFVLVFIRFVPSVAYCMDLELCYEADQK